MFPTFRKASALLSFAILCAACAAVPTRSGEADSQYVKLSGSSGYYLVRSNSPMRAQLGFSGAPVSDTSDRLHEGRGADVIAFRFDGRGLLSAPPAYIYQQEPLAFYTERLRAFSVGKSTLADVKEIFSGSILISRDGGALVYLTFRVRSPAERWP